MALSMSIASATPSSVQLQTTSRVTMQQVSAPSPRLTDRFAWGHQLRTPRSLGSRSPRRQVAAMAENPVSKVVKDAQKAAEDFGDAIQSNAEDTAEATEAAYQEPNPVGQDEEQPTDTYRATQLKDSDRKYAPKSDPTDLGAKKSPNEA